MSKDSECSTSLSDFFVKSEQYEKPSGEVTESTSFFMETENSNKELNFCASTSGTLQCQICHLMFFDISSLQLHTIKAHTNSDESLAFESSSLIKDSQFLDNVGSTTTPKVFYNLMQKNANPSLFTCQQCNTSFDQLSQFIVSEHLKFAHLNLSCPICYMHIEDQQEHMTHLMEHLVITHTTFACKQCSISELESSEEFRQHFLRCHTDMLYRCTLCLKDHMAVHSLKSSVFRCIMCAQSFDTYEKLFSHVQLTHNIVDYNSDNNNINLSAKDILNCSNRSLKKNLQLVSLNRNPDLQRRNNNGSLMATTASTSLCSTKTDINNRSQQPFSLKGLKCTVCDVQCMDELTLDEHKLFSHCKIIKSNRCLICGDVLFDGVEKFIEHSHTHFDMSEGTLSCIICRQPIRGEIQLKMHGNYHLYDKQLMAETNETIVYNNKCITQDITKQLPSTTNETIVSVASAQSISARPPTSIDHKIFNLELVCEACGEKFNDEDVLHNHTLHHLSSESSPLNSEAIKMRKQTKLLYTFKQKTVEKHSCTSNSFQCPNCPKKFSSLSALQGHSHIHMGGRNFRCKKCGQCFSSPSRLNAHQKRKQCFRNFKCRICDAQFDRFQC